MAPSKSTHTDYDVFLSFASANKEDATTIYKAAKKAGGIIFLSSEELHPGDLFDDEIKEALHSCREFWWLATRASLASQYVTTEWGAAWALNKKIVPILLGIEEDELPDRIKRRNAIRYDKHNNYIKEAFPSIRGLTDFQWNNVLRIVDNHLNGGDVICAIALGRAFLMVGEYYRSLEVFKHILKQIGEEHEQAYIVLGNIAYSLIGKNRKEYYEKAKNLLLKVQRINKGENFLVWHAVALAYTYKKLEKPKEYGKYLKKAKDMPPYKELADWFAQLYPSIKGDLLKE